MNIYYKILKNKGIRFTGFPRFISSTAQFDLSKAITIGERCVITNECLFLTHDYSYTTGLIAINESPLSDICIIGEITIGNNVFIGMRSTILPNTKIGDNVIIGAGSIVKGEIHPNSVYAGVPARYICSIENYITKQKKNNNQLHID